VLVHYPVAQRALEAVFDSGERRQGSRTFTPRGEDTRRSARYVQHHAPPPVVVVALERIELPSRATLSSTALIVEADHFTPPWLVAMPSSFRPAAIFAMLAPLVRAAGCKSYGFSTRTELEELTHQRGRAAARGLVTPYSVGAGGWWLYQRKHNARPPVRRSWSS
jgi:hypothetical protein